MSLELQLIKQPATEMPPQKTCLFNEQGGSIGRAEHCEFVLPDQTKSVSKAHALIHYRDGAYYLTDVSSNGVFVNNDPIPIGKGNTKQISDGQQFRVGNYLVLAKIGTQQPIMQMRSHDPIGAHDEIEKLLAAPNEMSELLPEEISSHKHSSFAQLQNKEQSIDAILQSLQPEEMGLDLSQFPTHNSDDLLAELIGGKLYSTQPSSVIKPVAVALAADISEVAEEVFSELMTYFSPQRFANMFSEIDPTAIYTEENFKHFCDTLQENKEFIMAAVLDKLNKKPL